VKQEIYEIFTTLNNEMQTKRRWSYPPEVLEELIKINSCCLAMNTKDCIHINEVFHRMQDLAFSLWDMEDKEGNSIISIYKIAGESEWKLPTERA
jgi:hypothetical protein